jgi:ABC-type branched-subunit amino acid transport system permease subunit
LRPWGAPLFVAAYVAATAFVARSDLGVQSLVLVAAVFGVLAISLDLVAGMLGLYSLGQGGFFAIGAYLTTIIVNDLGWSWRSPASSGSPWARCRSASAASILRSRHSFSRWC